MKTRVVLFIFIIFTLSGCAGSPQGSAQETSSPPVFMEPSSGSTPQVPTPEKAPEPVPEFPSFEVTGMDGLPHPPAILANQISQQARNEGCSVLYFSPTGELVKTLPIGAGYYSDARLSPNGEHILLEVNQESGGEGIGRSYATFHIQHKQFSRYETMHGGFQPFRILDNNLIGTAFYYPGEQYQAMQFFDINLKPIAPPFAFDFGETRELWDQKVYARAITGLTYDREREQYLLTYSIEQPDKIIDNMPHSANTLAVCVFDKGGTLLKELITQYRAPFSFNVLGLQTNNPKILPGGELLLTAQRSDSRETVPIIMNLETGAVVEQPKLLKQHGDSQYTVSLELVDADDHSRWVVKLTDSKNAAVLAIRNTKMELPTGALNIYDAVLDGSGGYLLAGDWNLTCLFRFEANAFHRLHYVATFPYGTANLMGVDEAGNAMVFNGRKIQYEE